MSWMDTGKYGRVQYLHSSDDGITEPHVSALTVCPFALNPGAGRQLSVSTKTLEFVYLVGVCWWWCLWCVPAIEVRRRVSVSKPIMDDPS